MLDLEMEPKRLGPVWGFVALGLVTISSGIVIGFIAAVVYVLVSLL